MTKHRLMIIVTKYASNHDGDKQSVAVTSNVIEFESEDLMENAVRNAAARNSGWDGDSTIECVRL